MGFVCSFPGRRDSFQVPIALAETGRLDAFITDHFCGALEHLAAKALPERAAERLESRYDQRIPQDRIWRLRHVALMQLAGRALRISPEQLYALCDPRYSGAATRFARRGRSDLFLYSAYAWDAFGARYGHNPKKILFQYHPHIAMESEVLRRDLRQSKGQGIAFESSVSSGEGGKTPRRLKVDSAWKRADHIICASTFTKNSLVAHGADPGRISVIPYGVDLPSEGMAGREESASQGLAALFVGSGVQRKGLHHLLFAWRRANLPLGSRLAIVARVIDPGLIPLMHQTDGVDYLGAVSQAELRRLYLDSTLFVMPSLVEGFGQVYLEALAHGMPVLGTQNTCCPDLGSEQDGVFTTTPGDIDELIAKLESLATLFAGDRGVRERARACAARFTWKKFRQRIQDVACGTMGA